jgi:hypothetical protein
MIKYEVGQVLFILAGASKGVVPVRICEEIKRKSLGGTTIDYMVNFPDRDEPINLKIAKNQVFISEDAVKAHMMKNAEHAIIRLLKSARTVAKKKFDYSPARPMVAASPKSPAPVVQEPTLESILDDGDNDPLQFENDSVNDPIKSAAAIEADGVALQLDDGTHARIHLPPEFQDLIGTGT